MRDENRFARLERRVARLSRLALLGPLVGLGAGILMGQADVFRRSDVNELVLRDAAGRKRAVLGFDEAGAHPGLWLFDSDGTARVVLGFDGAGNPGFWMFDERGSPHLWAGRNDRGWQAKVQQEPGVYTAMVRDGVETAAGVLRSTVGPTGIRLEDADRGAVLEVRARPGAQLRAVAAGDARTWGLPDEEELASRLSPPPAAPPEAVPAAPPEAVPAAPPEAVPAAPPEPGPAPRSP